MSEAPNTAYPQGYSYAPPTNTLAIVALVLAFVMAPAGIVCGHIALGQIKRTGERGRELALAGLITGYVITGLVVLMTIVYVIMMIVWFGMFAAIMSNMPSTAF